MARPSAPLCVENADRPGRREGRRERRVHVVLRIGVDHTHAVRADHARAGPAYLFADLYLELAPLVAGLGKAGADHHDRRNVRGDAVIDGGFDRAARYCHDGKIDRPRDRGDGGPGRSAADRRAVRVDREHVAAEPPAERLWKISAPMRPRRRPAPITAIERGEKKGVSVP
jgi:hypothetical protein